MNKNSKIVLKKTSLSEKDTSNIAHTFAGDLREGDVIALSGELGSGKTFFVREIAMAMGYDNIVTSPTFVILNIYDTKITIYHFDLYRIKDETELENIGFSDFINRKGIVFVEWPKIAQNILPNKYYNIKFDILGNRKRKICITKLEKE